MKKFLLVIPFLLFGHGVHAQYESLVEVKVNQLKVLEEKIEASIELSSFQKSAFSEAINEQIEWFEAHRDEKDIKVLREKSMEFFKQNKVLRKNIFTSKKQQILEKIELIKKVIASAQEEGADTTRLEAVLKRVYEKLQLLESALSSRDLASILS